ncbi:hypothetical protein GGS24DRAFT_466690 [Hypoxylon argillaceum]|nr:hypothetical protein GGS24DRAFT_466690 [Hypoxylon argillaceum]
MQETALICIFSLSVSRHFVIVYAQVRTYIYTIPWEFRYVYSTLDHIRPWLFACQYGEGERGTGKGAQLAPLTLAPKMDRRSLPRPSSGRQIRYSLLWG